MANLFETLWNLVTVNPALGLVIVFGWGAIFGLGFILFLSPMATKRQNKTLKIAIGIFMFIVLVMVLPLTIENLFR